MDDFTLRITLLIALVVIVIGGVMWLSRRGRRRAGRAHADSLAALATGLGATVVDPAEAWSAELAAPLHDDATGVVDRLSTVSRPRFDTALDFRRGGWRVRVSEVSMRKNMSNGTTTVHEHRIEVATARLAPMKISRRWHTDFRGRPLSPDHILAQGGRPVREMPSTVARERGEWLRAALPTDVDNEFVVYAADPSGVERALDTEAADWLLRHADVLPQLMVLEAGLLYAPAPGQIVPDRLRETVDAIVGLLERIPGAHA